MNLSFGKKKNSLDSEREKVREKERRKQECKKLWTGREGRERDVKSRKNDCIGT